MHFSLSDYLTKPDASFSCPRMAVFNFRDLKESKYSSLLISVIIFCFVRSGKEIYI